MPSPTSKGTGERSDTPGAEEQLHTTRQLLVYALRYSRVFPAEVTEEWIEAIGGLDVDMPEAGKAILSGLRDGYEWSKSRYRPTRDVLSPGAGSEAAFARETGEIERHLHRLEALMAACPDGREDRAG